MSALLSCRFLNVASCLRALLVTAFLSLATVVAVDAQPQPRVDVLDPHALPLGDGKVSTAPKRGHVFACNTQFRGGGAQHAGDWIHGSTWDATGKVTVQGDVSWPDAALSLSVADGERRIVGNGLPLKHTTGVFPIGRHDPAFTIDRNPNGIEAQQIAFALPLSPTAASAAQCVPMGVIGIALNGVALFNALDAAGRDAVAHEVQDRCGGHPERRGQYHYHGPSSCLAGATANNTLIGYALDGFGIFSMYDEHGKELTNADLDECHGRISRIPWNGKQVDLYHYVLTREYPYTVGCFRGTPVATERRMNAPPREGSSREDPPADGAPRSGPPQNNSSRNNGRRNDSIRDGPPEGPPSEDRLSAVGANSDHAARRPPPEAIAACSSRSDAAQCRFTSPRGDAIIGTCRSITGTPACVPERR